MEPLEHLDALGVAIADAGYAWTSEMRSAYEAAVKAAKPKVFHPAFDRPEIGEWLRTLNWVGPIRCMCIEYPAGRPDGLVSSERNDYYEAITAAGPNECLYVQITDTTYAELFGVDAADHSHEPDHHLYAESNG